VTLPRFLGLLLLAIACAHTLVPSARESAALRELLGTAVERSVARLGREGGFDEEAARIDLAAQLGPVARALHGVGMGARVIALESVLARAAERATAEVGPWLREEALRFAPADPDAVLSGPPDAATLAFRAGVEPDLAERLRKAAEGAVADAGVAEALAQVRDGAARLPLPREVALDPPAFVSERVRAAFFAVLAEEEARLRANTSGDARRRRASHPQRTIREESYGREARAC
jgi:hypothetical protein